MLLSVIDICYARNSLGFSQPGAINLHYKCSTCNVDEQKTYLSGVPVICCAFYVMPSAIYVTSLFLANMVVRARCYICFLS